MITINRKVINKNPKKQVKSKISDYKENSILNNRNFYNIYRDEGGIVGDFVIYCKILKLYFKKVKEYLYTGNKVNTPLGTFCVKKIYNHNKKYISFSQMKKENSKTVIYRDNEYFFGLNFTKNTSIKELFFYKFKFNPLNNCELFRHYSIFESICTI